MSIALRCHHIRWPCRRGVRVEVRTPILPTEDPEKVAAAASRFLENPAASEVDGRVIAVGHSLELLRQRVWELRIIDTFRGALLGGCEGNRLRFITSKQAAFAGKVSLPAAPHPLGDLAWTVTLDETDPWDDAEALAWWLCPETADGAIVGPT